MTGFRLAPEARADITDMWTYIADDSIEAAGRVRKGFLDSCRQLVKHPFIGHRRPDLTTQEDVPFLAGVFMLDRLPASYEKKCSALKEEITHPRSLQCKSYPLQHGYSCSPPPD
jgi:plasmid stabilization system protein ParE